jgi:hypothetical protein
MKSTPEQQARGEAFAQECRADGRMVQRGSERCTRRWLDRDAYVKWQRLSGSSRPHPTPAPSGSVPLKHALREVADAVGIEFETIEAHGWWRHYGIPLRIVRRLRTRVDVDPASIPAAIAWMREGRFRAGNAGTNGNHSRAILDGEQPAFAGLEVSGNPRDHTQ